MSIPKLLTTEDYEAIKGIVENWIKTAKPVVLDVKVVENLQSILPEDQSVVDAKLEPEGLRIEEPEEQEPQESPEA